MNQREFRRNCNCEECRYMKTEQTPSGDDKQVCIKRSEVIEDMKFGKDKCRYSK